MEVDQGATLVPLSPATADALEEGRALFDAGRYWEAHEAWEVAWRVEGGPARQLLHGLIQVAAGGHHLTVTRRTRGASRLLASGLRKLQPLPGDLGGLALDAFRSDVARLLEAARPWLLGEPGAAAPAALPPLRRRTPSGHR